MGETWTPQPIKQASSNQLFNSTDTTRLRRWLVFINALHSIDLLSWGFQPHWHLYRYHTFQSKIFKFLINSSSSFYHLNQHLNILIINEKVKHYFNLFWLIFNELTNPSQFIPHQHLNIHRIYERYKHYFNLF